MKRIFAVMMALVFVIGIASYNAIGDAVNTSQPRLIMSGNGGVCSLSSHKTFRIKLTGWKPNSTVQLKLYYGSGADYPYPLRNEGQVKVNDRGSHIGPPWPCWPNKQYNVADKKTYYIVFAFQIGSKPLAHATSVFRVVK
jgi:hypothetical protein